MSLHLRETLHALLHGLLQKLCTAAWTARCTYEWYEQVRLDGDRTLKPFLTSEHCARMLNPDCRANT